MILANRLICWCGHKGRVLCACLHVRFESAIVSTRRYTYCVTAPIFIVVPMCAIRCFAFTSDYEHSCVCIAMGLCVYVFWCVVPTQGIWDMYIHVYYNIYLKIFFYIFSVYEVWVPFWYEWKRYRVRVYLMLIYWWWWWGFSFFLFGRCVQGLTEVFKK